MSIEAYIKKEVQERNIVLFYQKIVTKAGSYQYECLARMKNNTSISPEDFIPIIVKLNLYEDFTETIIKKSFETFKNKKILFSINLSYMDFLNKNIFLFLIKQLEKFNLGKYLILEILEEEIKDFSVVNNFINKLKPYGVQIAIDDFGKNHSNLARLLYLHPDFLKIDIFLIKEFNTNDKAKKILENIVDLGRQLNVKIVAEGVENEKTYQALLKYNIYAFQGYYFSKPDNRLL